ncbi:hypothetical protein [Thermonema rossianum]|uniref:hypothetical protein n=1 Tax=Thermonema rossianum TaxID=55505 RepID=UPI000570960D|nr:hypothetical protein [Thermonema rossianum]
MDFFQKAWRLSGGILVVAALIGVVLRLYPFYSFDFVYKHLLHAHSHVAVLGWLFAGFYLFMVWLFVPETAQVPFRRLFYAMQLAVAGMLFTFPVQGYGPLSIPFSTLHILLSYVAIYRLVPFIRTAKQAAVLRYGSLLALAFHFLATLGTWALAIVMAKKLKQTPAYDLSIKWYLHLEFQGWFFMAAFVVAAYFLLRQKTKLHGWRIALSLWALAVLGSYSLYPAWHGIAIEPLMLVHRFSVAAEMIASIWWFRQIWRNRTYLRARTPSRLLMAIALLAFAARQCIVAMLWHEPLALQSMGYRSAIIGFLHLMHLGIFTHVLWGWASSLFAVKRLPFYIGLGCFHLGFGLQEFLLFAQALPLIGQQGLFLSPRWLAGAALLLALGSALLITSFSKTNHKKLQTI